MHVWQGRWSRGHLIFLLRHGSQLIGNRFPTGCEAIARTMMVRSMMLEQSPPCPRRSGDTRRRSVAKSAGDGPSLTTVFAPISRRSQPAPRLVQGFDERPRRYCTARPLWRWDPGRCPARFDALVSHGETRTCFTNQQHGTDRHQTAHSFMLLSMER